MRSIRLLWDYSERIEALVELQHGFRLTGNLAIDVVRRVPSSTPDEVVAAVAQRCLMVKWMLEGNTAITADDPKALQWACHLGMISEFEYHAVTGKHSDEYIPPAGVKPWQPLEERNGILGAFSGPRKREPVR